MNNEDHPSSQSNQPQEKQANADPAKADKNLSDKESNESENEISYASFSGPLPPPNVLAGYNDAVKDGAERLLKMTENQSNHRMKMEYRGQWFAFILGLMGLTGAVIVGIYGSPWVGVTIGGGTLVILVVAFLKGSFIKE